MATHRRLAESGPDYYPTPNWATEALLKHEHFTGDIWEPACGAGHMAEVLKRYGHKVIATDLYHRGYGRSGYDFTEFNLVDEVDNIITNPPFALAESFFAVGYKAAKRKLALLLRLAFLESRRRHDSIFSKHPPARVWVFSERLSMYPHGHSANSGGTTSYAWFVWDKESNSKPEICWLPPGLRQ